MKKLTTQEFVDRARAVHGDRYGYAFSVYVSSRDKIMIHCPEHGFFEQLPTQHMSGQGCPRCDMRLMQGDCLEHMKEIPDGSVDMVLTDPPYGTTACKWDSIIPLEPMWEQLTRIIKPSGAIVMTAAQPFTTTLIASNMKVFKYVWQWKKSNLTNFLNAKKQPLRCFEDVVVFCDGQSTYNPQMVETGNRKVSRRTGIKTSVYGKADKEAFYDSSTRYPTQLIEIANRVDGKYHPTQKPVALMEYLIKTYTNEGETVLDFTMGSGTTGVACANTGRKFIGIELDLNYFNIALERIEKSHA